MSINFFPSIVTGKVRCESCQGQHQQAERRRSVCFAIFGKEYNDKYYFVLIICV